MHPIERLRFVARSQGAPPEVLVRETAMALAAFGDDSSALVTACRRVVSRQVSCGPLWWLCARVLCAADPIAAARQSMAEMEADTTVRSLAAVLPDDATVVVVGWPPLVARALVRRGDCRVLVVETDGAGAAMARELRRLDGVVEVVEPVGVAGAVLAADLVVLEASAVSVASGAVVTAGSVPAAAVAAHLDTAVWLAVGVGRLLPEPAFDVLAERTLGRAGAEPWVCEHERLSLGLVDRIVGPAGLDHIDSLDGRIDSPVAPELFKPAIT